MGLAVSEVMFFATFCSFADVLSFGDMVGVAE